jgi:2-alkyl-3-oxoalkanoate reductase
MQERRVLVTGGCGFVGNCIAQSLAKSGHSVLVLDTEVGIVDDPTPGIEYIEGEYWNGDVLSRIMEGVDSVFHCACFSNNSMKGVPREKLFQSIVDGTRMILSECLARGVQQLIFTSTSYVIFDGSELDEVEEEDAEYPPHFLDDYTEAMAEAEKSVLESARESKFFQTCVLRGQGVFGPGETDFVTRVLSRAMKSQTMFRVRDASEGNDKGALQDFVFIENFVRAHLVCFERLLFGSRLDGRVYFITNGEPMRLWEFLEQLLGHLDVHVYSKSIPFSIAYSLASISEWVHWGIGRFFSSAPLVTRFAVARAGVDHTFYCGDAERDFGYDALVTMKEGIQRTAEFYKEDLKR